jgi:hypothetical protein
VLFILYNSALDASNVLKISAHIMNAPLKIKYMKLIYIITMHSAPNITHQFYVIFHLRAHTHTHNGKKVELQVNTDTTEVLVHFLS